VHSPAHMGSRVDAHSTSSILHVDVSYRACVLVHTSDRLDFPQAVLDTARADLHWRSYCSGSSKTE
jgi:hypothetical protein